ncbi:hypothetical protein [Roseovarius sp. M141]|uniref:hypothetical protein n=1 Tax=Roseovarius sp. M141 TaxID=2583806 RepID=UPI0020CC04EA|nr:hypothetical protein [Roseovarius sp. M141]MCQ0090949.1 hypothetical protein [Roseovarius sp. M141]
MLTNTDQYEELAVMLPNHFISLDVTVEATDMWNVLSRCALEFASHDMQLLKVSRVHDSAVYFRLDCRRYSDIARLEAALKLPDAPKALKWEITIGRRK